MSWKPSGLILVLAAAVVALVLVPGSLSAAEDGDGALAIALEHVSGNAADLGVTSADVADLVVTSRYTSAHSGITHVNLNQRHQGLEVFGGHVTVNVGADGAVVFAAGSLAELREASGAAELGAAEAVEAAAEGLGLDEPADLELLEEDGAEALVSGGGISDEPIPAKLGWQPTADGLRLAWQLVIDDSSDVHLWSATVDAETGELLASDDWTSEHPIEELASTLGRGGNPGGGEGPGGYPAAAPGTTNPVLDGSSYRVYEIPKESPNDGPRTLVQNPADALASPFGWHDTDGAVGPEFTITRGNNAHAYTDRNNSNTPDVGGEPNGGPSLTFDFPLDLTQPPQTYGDAAVTNLFYWCNVAHDLFYLYGFTEPAGNFQANNYGRGGVGGDYVRCEAQDGGGVNNANFSTPAADGGTPRMQMYLWNPGGGVQPNLVTVDAPSPAAGTYQASGAAFGPVPTAAGVSGQIVVVSSGPNPDFPAALPNEGCGPLVGFPAGAIALADRGTCPFVLKVANAQAAGAAAVIVGNNVAGAPITMGGADPTITIPAVMVSLPDTNTIKAGLPATGKVSSNPAAVQRDGDLESGIIFHEYGHGLSLRLTGGPGINCLTGNEQMGEGWSDYVAIAGLLDPALDDPEGPRGMGPYVLWQDTRQGNGIRPRPYSRNMEIQPFTYDSIKTGAWLGGASLAVPHGIGHGWAAILWDMTWDLVEKHGFNGNIYEPWNTGGNNRAYQYMVDGLKLQGCTPGFVVGRAAIVAAAQALGGEDVCTLWASFSRRGLGFGAVQGTAANRNDNDEAFDTHPACRKDFAAGAPRAYGDLNQADPGKVVQLKVDLGGNQGADVLASNSPFSRKVDCATLRVPSIGASVTPREYPIPAATPDGQGLKYKQNEGLYVFPWQTEDDWLGTCRELVMTMKDGTQHRAFFRFLYPFSGFTGTFASAPALNDTSSKNISTFWWKLGGDRGLGILQAGYPQSRPIDCATFAPLGAYEPTATPSWDSLGYQAHTQRYYYPWQPPKGNNWLGTCREFTIALVDGTSHSAYLRYVK
jgi:extracellular elastinolytic metalloproteinase